MSPGRSSCLSQTGPRDFPPNHGLNLSSVYYDGVVPSRSVPHSNEDFFSFRRS